MARKKICQEQAAEKEVEALVEGLQLDNLKIPEAERAHELISIWMGPESVPRHRTKAFWWLLKINRLEPSLLDICQAATNYSLKYLSTIKSVGKFQYFAISFPNFKVLSSSGGLIA